MAGLEFLAGTGCKKRPFNVQFFILNIKFLSKCKKEAIQTVRVFIEARFSATLKTPLNYQFIPRRASKLLYTKPSGSVVRTIDPNDITISGRVPQVTTVFKQ